MSQIGESPTCELQSIYLQKSSDNLADQKYICFCQLFVHSSTVGAVVKEKKQQLQSAPGWHQQQSTSSKQQSSKQQQQQQSKAPTLPQTATIACGVSTRVPLTAFPPSSTVQQVLPRVKRGEGVHYVKVQTIYLYIISPGHLGWCLLVISQVIHPLPPGGRCCSRAKLDYQADIIGHLGDD